MLIADIGHKNIRRPKAHRMFRAIQPIFHLSSTVAPSISAKSRAPGASGGEIAIILENLGHDSSRS
jgi:hypothetical protein